MQSFADRDRVSAHQAFQDWRRYNENGFCINVKSENEAILHRATCPHLGDPMLEAGEWGSLTKRKKLCSTDRQELVQWAAKDFAGSFEECADCKP